VPKRTSRGRPKKIAWEDRLANGIISSKIALPALIYAKWTFKLSENY
jgi:hypothetical protein